MSNRKAVRKAIATALTPLLVGAGLPAQTVHNHRKARLAGLSPFIAVVSAGTGQLIDSYASVEDGYLVDVLVFALVKAQDGTYTEAEADDALDDCTEIVTDWAGSQAAQNNTNWNVIEMAGRTEITSWIIEGEEWLRERIPLNVTVNS